MTFEIRFVWGAVMSSVSAVIMAVYGALVFVCVCLGIKDSAKAK